MRFKKLPHLAFSLITACAVATSSGMASASDLAPTYLKDDIYDRVIHVYNSKAECGFHEAQYDAMHVFLKRAKCIEDPSGNGTWLLIEV